VLYAGGAILNAQVLVVKADECLIDVRRLVSCGLRQNSRSKVVLTRKLGWNPTNGGLKMSLEDAKETVNYVLNSSKSGAAE
jgi:hypothetical protein